MYNFFCVVWSSAFERLLSKHLKKIQSCCYCCCVFFNQLKYPLLAVASSLHTLGRKKCTCLTLLCYFSDDCSSCVQRSFKVHELVEKACQEYDFGKRIKWMR